MRRTNSICLFSLLAAIASLIPAITPAQQSSAPEVPKPSLTASRRTNPIHLDGKLDEHDWTAAAVATNFVQRFPDPGHAATLQTAVRILYDNEAIYVGARMFDSHPDSIKAPLARRDPGDVNSDWFDVILDSYHDHRTGFRFAVNPVGTRLDVYHFNDGDDDNSWDARWDVATHIDSLGWTAEFRIPLSQLRFRGSIEEQLWGLQFYRAVARHDEWTFWSPYPPTTPGFVSAFGELRGLIGLNSATPVEIVPYVSSRSETHHSIGGNPFTQGTHLNAATGADFRVGLGSALSLTGAVNPDFGQVEVDPAELNLSEVETFFPEKRPFFLEGAGIFEFGALPVSARYGFSRFVHWRRIGRTPQLSPNAYWSDSPDNTSILGAAKLSGQTANGWSIGILDAVTNREEAETANANDERHAIGVEPRSNYFVSRIKRDLNGGRTAIGMLATATNRSLDTAFAPIFRSGAFLYGVDGTHASKNRRWTLGGSWIGSRVEGSADAIAATQQSSVRYFQRPDAPYLHFDSKQRSLSGHDAMLGVVYQGVPVFGSLQLHETSPGFEINDLGYASRTDARSIAAAIGATHDASATLLRSTRVTVYTLDAWNFGGDAIYQELGFTSSAELRSFWQVSMRAGYRPAVLDDRGTRGGPLMVLPKRWTAASSVNSDSRRKIIAGLGYAYQHRPAGGSENTLTPTLTLRPSPSLQISAAPTFDVVNDNTQYVRTASNISNTLTNGSDFIFASLHQKTIALNARVDWTLSTALSVQLFAQPFVSSAAFSNYKALMAPRSFAFDVYGQSRGTTSSLPDGSVQIDPDGNGTALPFTLTSANNETSFISRALRFNTTIRWEYRSGSVLFLVWQQTRDGHAQFDALTDQSLSGVLGTPAKDVLFLKATFHLGR